MPREFLNPDRDKRNRTSTRYLNLHGNQKRAVGATNFNKITSNKSKMDAVHSILDVDLRAFEHWLKIQDVDCLMSTTRHTEYLGDGKHSSEMEAKEVHNNDRSLLSF